VPAVHVPVGHLLPLDVDMAPVLGEYDLRLERPGDAAGGVLQGDQLPWGASEQPLGDLWGKGPVVARRGGGDGRRKGAKVGLPDRVVAPGDEYPYDGRPSPQSRVPHPRAARPSAVGRVMSPHVGPILATPPNAAGASSAVSEPSSSASTIAEIPAPGRSNPKEEVGQNTLAPKRKP